MRRREHRVGIVVVVKITRGWRDTYVYVGRNVIRNIKNYKRSHAGILQHTGWVQLGIYAQLM